MRPTSCSETRRTLHYHARGRAARLAWWPVPLLSLVVLPFALILPASWEVAAVVIVAQSLVELFGMVFYLGWLPRLFRSA